MRRRTASDGGLSHVAAGRGASPTLPEVVDALLICPDGRTRATYAAVLSAEGYRLRTVESVPLAEMSLRNQPAEIAFMPSVDAHASTQMGRERLERLAIPIVLLGDGWTERVRAGSRSAPRSGRGRQRSDTEGS